MGTQSSPTHHRHPVIDPVSALDRLGGDDALLRDMAGFFLEDVPNLLDDLARAIQQENTEAVTRAAHSVKGLALNFDATTAVDVARAIEASGQQGNLVRAAELLPALRDEVDAVMDAIKTHILA